MEFFQIEVFHGKSEIRNQDEIRHTLLAFLFGKFSPPSRRKCLFPILFCFLSKLFWGIHNLVCACQPPLVVMSWWSETESNRRHEDFQSPALPTELSDPLAGRAGFEPAEGGWPSRAFQARAFDRSAIFPYGGEGGIRTRGRFHPPSVFETDAFDRSATSP